VTADERRIRVLFVEDHRLLADSLSAMLAREPDIEVIGIAGTVAEAKELSRQRPDVVLMDYHLPDGTGADATRAIKARWPSARVVMVTALSDDETVLESIQAGADGYLTKDRAAGLFQSAPVLPGRAGSLTESSHTNGGHARHWDSEPTRA
jgi:DNA-binding NarL/FixJ family response regulator